MATSSMRPIRELSPRTARTVRVVFTDIDDTLTTRGRIPASAFAALWDLEAAGIAVVPVTGRPAGWCDHLARMWPVAGVIGENGAFYFRYDPDTGCLERRFLLERKERARLQARLLRLSKRILAEVPGAALASDQPYRIHDLAIDYREDVPPLAREKVQAIVDLFAAAGATAKVSSIHVNGWFGRYDKLGMILRFANEVLDLDLRSGPDRRRALYVGDSPNDEPAFAFFDVAVGVANVRRFATVLAHPPRYVTRAEGGAGFAEIARHLLRSRSSRSPSRNGRRA